MRGRGLGGRAAAVVAAGLWAVALHGIAAAGERVSAARIGFAGAYRTGSWTPLELEFAGDHEPPGAVRIWVDDPDGQPVGSFPVPVERVEQGVARATLAVRFGRPDGRVRVEIDPPAATATTAPPGDAEPLELPAPLAAGETVLLVIGDLPAAERAARLLALDDGTRPRVVTIDPAAPAGTGRLPGPSGRDYDGADAIIVCGRAAAVAATAAVEGIDEWVRQGGRLVFLAGKSAADLGRANSPAAGWLPGPVARLVPLRRGAAVETYARSNRPLDRGALAGMEVPLLANARELTGSVEAYEGQGPADLPLVVRRAHGFGTITWVGLDADLPPFRGWSGADALVVEALGGRAFMLPRDGGRETESRRGVIDLLGQLRRAVDRFAGVSPIPFEIIAGLGLLYVACLYPLAWWVSGGGRRSWRAWLSLPILVAAMAGVTGLVAARWHGEDRQGGGWRGNSAELVDVDLERGFVRSTAFAGVWSPDNARLTVAVAPVADSLPLASGTAVGPRGDVSWFAAGGRGIGATDAVAAHPSLAAGPYACVAPDDRAGEVAALADVPIAAASSRLFEAVVTGSAAAEPLRSTLRRQVQGTLRGTIESRLPFPLEGCGLLHGGWYYDIGRLTPGATFDTGLGRGPRSLSGALTRRTTNKDREIAIRWNPAEGDATRILEIAGFHLAAGGAGYTGLEPGRLARLDLSPLLALDRAVLIGRGPPLAGWRCTATPLGSGLAAEPALTGPASLWRFVVPLGAAPAGTLLDSGTDSPDDSAAPGSPPAS